MPCPPRGRRLRLPGVPAHLCALLAGEFLPGDGLAGDDPARGDTAREGAADREPGTLEGASLAVALLTGVALLYYVGVLAQAGAMHRRAGRVSSPEVPYRW